jgi:hypothetical protein
MEEEFKGILQGWKEIGRTVKLTIQLIEYFEMDLNGV